QRGSRLGRTSYPVRALNATLGLIFVELIPAGMDQAVLWMERVPQRVLRLQLLGSASHGLHEYFRSGWKPLEQMVQRVQYLSGCFVNRRGIVDSLPRDYPKWFRS